MSYPARGWILMALLVIGWGGNWPASKLALTQFDPLLQRSLALFLGGLGLLALTIRSKQSLRIAREDLRPFVAMTFFQVTFWHLTSVYGIYLMPAGRASIIANSVPIWVALLSYLFLSEPFTKWRSVGLIFGVLGLLTLAFGDMNFAGLSGWGPALMCLASLSGACAAIVMKSHAWKTSAMPLTGWSVFLGGIPIYLGAAVFSAGVRQADIGLEPLLGLAYTICVATIFCHWSWFSIVRIFPAPIAASSMFGVPVLGVLASSAILGEAIGWGDVLALCLTLGGIFFIIWGDRLLAPAACGPAR